MGRKNYLLVYELIDIINRAGSESSDVEIAKLLLENRFQLDRLSLTELSEMSYHSQASLSRFIKKVGYKNYDHFRRAMFISLHDMKNTYVADPLLKTMDTNQIKDDVYSAVLESLEYMNNLDNDMLENIVNEFFGYKQVVFAGSDLSMSIIYVLQLALLTRGIISYSLHDKFYQKEFLKNNNKKTMVIAITIEDRWLESNDFIDLIDENKDNNLCDFVLWSLNPNTIYKDKFDKVIYYGKPIEHDFGYHELMYFTMILYKILLKHPNI